MSCGVSHRCGLDLALLWLWCRPVATALIRPLAWEPPYAMGVALKKAKTKQKQKQTNQKRNNLTIPHYLPSRLFPVFCYKIMPHVCVRTHIPCVVSGFSFDGIPGGGLAGLKDAHIMTGYARPLALQAGD